jgi:hypothetical protein
MVSVLESCQSASSVTFVRLPAPETLRGSGLSAFKARTAIAAIQIRGRQLRQRGHCDLFAMRAMREMNVTKQD